MTWLINLWMRLGFWREIEFANDSILLRMGKQNCEAGV